MDLRPITESYSVTGQISVEDLTAIKAAGFKSIVCHRPDGEAADQPSFASIRQAAAGLGIEMRHIPVGPMGVTAEAVREMRLEPGVLAVAVIKSTNVIVETPGGLS